MLIPTLGVWRSWELYRLFAPPGVGVNNPGGGWFANAANADELGSSSEGVKRKGSEGGFGVGSRSSCSCPNLFPVGELY